MEKMISLSAVSMKTALKYRRDWNKNGPAVKLLRKMMPKGSKDFRIYVPIGESVHTKLPTVPHAVRHALKEAGFRVTDYLAKKCVKIADKEQKNFYNIGKVIAKDPIAKAAFDNDPQLQNSKTDKFMMVVSCHPYDIIGMSTGRDWDNVSCMRLDDDLAKTRHGSNYSYVANDVAEGTLVVYAIKTDDTNIKQPLGRCLIKPFVNENKDVLYRRETKIYGNPVPGFDQTINRFLRRLNKDVPAGFYNMVKGLYDDSIKTSFTHTTSESEEKAANSFTDFEEGNASETLEMYPERAGNYVAYRIAKEKRDQEKHASDDEDKRDAWQNAMHDVIGDLVYAPHTATNLKSVGRIIGSTPEAAQGFYDSFTHGSLRPMLNQLFRSPTLRKAMQQVQKKPIEEFRTANSLRNHTFIGPEYSAAFLEKFDMLDPDLDMDDLTTLVENYFKGWINFSAADLEKWAPLKGLIWLWANIQRTSELYDKEPIKNAEQVYRVLATVSKPEKIDAKYKRGLLVHFYEDGDQIAVGTWGMMARKDDPEFFPEISRMWTEPVSECIGNRRFRREIMKLAATDKELATVLGKAIASRVTDDEMGPELKGDLLNYVKANNLGINTIGFTKLNKLMIRAPEFMPYAYCNMPRQYTAKYVMEEGDLDRVIQFWKEYKGERVTAISEDQQKQFDIIGTVLSIQHPPIAAPFDFDSTKALGSLKRSEYLLSFGADFHKFPTKLKEDQVRHISMASFMRDDLGAKSLKIIGKQAPTPYDAAKWLQKITYAVFLWPGVMDSIDMKPRSGTLEFEDYAMKHSEEQVRAMHASIADRFTKGLDFFDSLPNYDTEPPAGEKEFFARMGIKQYEENASNELGRVFSQMADATSSIAPTFKKIWSGISLANPELAQELYDSVKPLIERANATWAGHTKDGEPIYMPKKDAKVESRPASRSRYA